jgi:hypothetical protein
MNVLGHVGVAYLSNTQLKELTKQWLVELKNNKAATRSEEMMLSS